MTKNIYDLSVHTQTADDQRIIKTSTGKEYNVSFRPAILNRKYYQRWTDLQTEIIASMTEYNQVRAKLLDGVQPTEEDIEKSKKWKELTTEAAEAGAELIIYAIRANGYEFDEDELYTNFSEKDMAYAVNYIMGIDADKIKDIKKKSVSKKTSSKTGSSTKKSS